MRDTAGSGGGDVLTAIVDAAIEADLQHNGWNTYAGEGLMRIFSGGAHAILTPSTGAYEIRNATSVADAEIEAAIKQVEQIYAKWPGKVEAAFSKWAALPQPGFNTGEIAWLEHGEGELRTGTAPPTNTDVDGPVIGFANQRLAADLLNLNNRVGQLSGMYAEAFQERYLAPLPSAIQGLGAVIACLGLSCQGQGAIWEAAAKDVETIQRDAVKAMKGSAPGGGGGSVGLTILAVGGAIAGLVAAIPTGGASVAAVAGLLSAGAGFLGAVAGASGGEKEVALGAGTPDAVMTRIEAALRDLSDAILEQEQRLGDFLTAVLNEIEANRSSLDLSAPEARQNAVLDRQQNVIVDAGIIARITELWIPTICGDLRSARSDLVVTSRVFSERPSGVGLAPDGAWPQFEAVQETTIDMLTRMVHELGVAADALNDAARTIGLQDQETSADARREAERINNSDTNFVS
jgi:hypothetical protein